MSVGFIIDDVWGGRWWVFVFKGMGGWLDSCVDCVGVKQEVKHWG